ncbi:unnamed protein product [Rangifer tarandus platyrhynchus]|uniref:Uncharacterized protein n=2 Tax=Rangifer tarandus platyrhynchus TaxID=3082113 RepID=A0ABN9A048_RANTA|nr:unnamed protein product [Rangifer tarandus platyrhynchus]CAI9711187.1 unnamed protein product [Rangifer tarandus platyrhynchus]
MQPHSRPQAFRPQPREGPVAQGSGSALFPQREGGCRGPSLGFEEPSAAPRAAVFLLPPNQGLREDNAPCGPSGHATPGPPRGLWPQQSRTCSPGQSREREPARPSRGPAPVPLVPPPSPDLPPGSEAWEARPPPSRSPEGPKPGRKGSAAALSGHTNAVPEVRGASQARGGSQGAAAIVSAEKLGVRGLAWLVRIACGAASPGSRECGPAKQAGRETLPCALAAPHTKPAGITRGGAPPGTARCAHTRAMEAT